MYEGQTVWIQNNEYTSSDSELDDDDEEEDDAKDFLASVFSSLVEDDSSLDDSSDELADVIYVYVHLLVFWLRSCLARTTRLVDNMISYFCFFLYFPFIAYLLQVFFLVFLSYFLDFLFLAWGFGRGFWAAWTAFFLYFRTRWWY